MNYNVFLTFRPSEILFIDLICRFNIWYFGQIFGYARMLKVRHTQNRFTDTH